MSPVIISSIGLGLLFLLMIFHVPVGAAMIIAGLIAFGLQVGVAPAISLLASEPAGYFASQDLAVVPMFLLMGAFAASGGLSQDLYRLAYAFLGHRRGGLAYATIGGCAGFGAICGSSVATAATMSKIAMPEMRQRGYHTGFAAGTIAAGGGLGMLIPPSIVMVVYAIMTEQFIVAMFAAALIPALIAILMQFMAIFFYARLYPQHCPLGERIGWPERFRLLGQSWRVLTLALVVSGGLYGGVFTVNEAAAVGAILADLFAWQTKTLTKEKLISVFLETAATTAMLYLMVIGAAIFTYFLSVSRIPLELVSWVQGLGLEPLTVVIILLLIYLAIGCIFESISSLIVTLPFVFPLILEIGVDPIWWGVLCIMVIEIGLVTPPIGMNLFVIHSMAPDLPLRRIAVGTIPYLGFDMIRLALLIFIPALTLWLPMKLGML